MSLAHVCQKSGVSCAKPCAKVFYGVDRKRPKWLYLGPSHLPTQKALYFPLKNDGKIMCSYYQLVTMCKWHMCAEKPSCVCQAMCQYWYAQIHLRRFRPHKGRSLWLPCANFLRILGTRLWIESRESWLHPLISVKWCLWQLLLGKKRNAVELNRLNTVVCFDWYTYST